VDEALAGFLSRCLARPVAVRSVERIAVGHSRAMYRVDTDAGGFVVRVEQGGVFGTSGAEEFRVMRALACAGYPVARVRWEEPTGTVLGRPFFVMALVPCAAAGGTDDRAMDGPTAAAFVAVLARLHARDAGPLAAAFRHVPASPGTATHDQVERWAHVYRSAVGEPVALLEEAAAWLHRHAPPLERLAVVHGDAGPGNVVCAGGEVVAVTDWEFAHLGDPAEDWSFCLAMRGRRTMGSEAWLALFEQVAGFSMPPVRWRFWEAFNLFKGACANTTALALFESGANRAPDMAIIGGHLHQAFLRRLVDITGEGP
jgi:aminoglycoside phosphotransferase (APT) family kinase protein